GRVGFFARGSHALVEIESCLVAEPDVDRGIAFVRAAANGAPRALARFESVEVRALEDGALAFALERRQGHARSLADVRSDEALVLERLGAHGEARVARAGAEFSQVNRAVNDALVARLVDGALARRASSFVDLYAGSGNFGVPLARAGLRGVS